MTQNRRREPVSYRPFRTEPFLADGLLAVARPGTEIWDSAARVLLSNADALNRAGAEKRAREGEIAGKTVAAVNGPRARIGADIPGGTTAEEMAATLLRKEEGFRDSPYWDVNHDRIGYGSDTVTLADGTVKKTVRGMRISREDGERDLARRVREGQGRIVGQVGEENWNRLPPAARAAILSVGYNYGTPPAVVLEAAKTGDVERVAAAIEGLSANPARRKREAAIVRAGVGPGATPAAPELTGGTWRPTGSDTAFGRAYDDAGTRTYLQMLDTEMRDTVGQLFAAHGDDPVALERALAANRRDMGQRHVFDEIRGDFERVYNDVSAKYLDQARQGQRRKMEEADRAAFFERTLAMETRHAQLIAGFDPETGNAAAAIAGVQQSIDQHYDAAVDRGLITADGAVRAKVGSRREAALAFYKRQADRLDAEGVKRMREEMRADFADGGIDGLDGDGWGALDGALDALERNKRGEVERLERDFVGRGDEQAARIVAGFEPDPDAMARLRLDAGRAPGGEAALGEIEAKIATVREIRDGSLRQGRDVVDRLRRELGETPTPAQLRTFDLAAGALEAKRRAIATDPVGYAERARVVPETPGLLDGENGAEIADILRRRVDNADQAAERLGIQPRFLKAGEAAAIAALVRAKPDQGAAVAAAIVSGAGARPAAVLAEFGDDAPMIAEAGAILAFDGSPRAAEDVIGGYGKGPDGKPLKPLKPAVARETFRRIEGGALALAPEDRSRVERAAAAIARKRIADDGLDPDGEEARAIHERAIVEAAGGVFVSGVQFGGLGFAGGGVFSQRPMTRVLVPPMVRADRFGDLLGAITDADLAALPVKPKAGIGDFYGNVVERSPARVLAAARPVVVKLPNGKPGYAFAHGNPAGPDPQFVEGENGEIFVLDVMALRDRLEPRVPGAFR